MTSFNVLGRPSTRRDLSGRALSRGLAFDVAPGLERLITGTQWNAHLVTRR